VIFPQLANLHAMLHLNCPVFLSAEPEYGFDGPNCSLIHSAEGIGGIAVFFSEDDW